MLAKISRTLSVAVVLVLVTLNPKLVSSQVINRSQSEQEEYLRETTKQRSFDELVQAISDRDEGNYDHVAVFGLTSFGMVKKTLVTRQLMQDRRVRKLYQLLDAMDEGEAAAKAAEIFTRKLSEFKELSKENRQRQTQRYGLHAACFLAFEFCQRDDFNRLFDDWHDWFMEQVANNAYRTHGGGNASDSIRKYAFERMAGPEMMMYLNLYLIERSRQGRSFDEATSDLTALLIDVGVDAPISPYMTKAQMLPYDSDDEETEPLLEIFTFASWGGLDGLDTVQRMRLLSRAKNVIDPPSLVEQAEQSLADPAYAAHEATESLKSRLQDKTPRLKRLKSGTRITFIGPTLTRRLSQDWTAKDPPTKKYLLVALNRLRGELPEEERPKWDEAVDEARDWVLETPESGVHAKERMIFLWPKDGNDDQKLSDPESEHRIKLELINTLALIGPNPEDK